MSQIKMSSCVSVSEFLFSSSINYRPVYVPILTYAHELRVVTERTRSKIQAAEMGFLRRVSGLSLGGVRSSVSREGLGVEPLLLHIERSQIVARASG